MGRLSGTAYRFADRCEAGRLLAVALARYASRPDAIVLALPRGGVPVGYEIALALRLPLDVFEVRKLGVPGHEELAMGAIASGGLCHVRAEVAAAFRVGPAQMRDVIDRERRELERREQVYRAGRPRADVAGRTIVLVDDGLATGATMEVALAALREQHPSAIVVAVPVAPSETCDALRTLAQDVVCLRQPAPFYGGGAWYRNFRQVGDGDVRSLLHDAASRSAGPAVIRQP